MYRIGVDLGGTNIAVGLVNENYQIVRKDSTPTRAKEHTALEITDDIAMLCRRLCEAHGISLSDLDAIGIASPGVANSEGGYVEYANNLPFSHFPICAELAARTGVQNIHVENDANAAAWGEAMAGAAKGARHAVMITLGTGVGGGAICDGKLISGFNFAGGELGHIVIEKGGVPCSCGRLGCWEAYSSATALIRMTKEKLEQCQKQGRETYIEKLVAERGKISGKTAFDAMRAGDAAGKEVVDAYIGYLAVGVGNIINIFQPEVLSIGGGVSGEGDYLLDMLVPLVRAEVYGQGIVNGTDIRIASLGNDAGIIGGAVLGLK